MDRWAGKVAIVTGASRGIGAAISRSLVNQGVRVVGLARQQDKLQELAATLGINKFYPIQCDLRNEDDILKAFKWTEEQLGGADILVNNAGVVSLFSIIDTPTEEYRRIFDTNVIAPAICAREFAQSIKKRKAAGHIINISSIAGHFAETIQVPIGMYSASKYALRAMSTELRHEIIEANLNIKITNISPGEVLTDMFINAVQIDRKILEKKRILKDTDVAEAVMSALGMPQGTEIHDILIMPQNLAIGTRGEKYLQDEIKT